MPASQEDDDDDDAAVPRRRVSKFDASSSSAGPIAAKAPPGTRQAHVAQLASAQRTSASQRSPVAPAGAGRVVSPAKVAAPLPANRGVPGAIPRHTTMPAPKRQANAFEQAVNKCDINRTELNGSISESIDLIFQDECVQQLKKKFTDFIDTTNASALRMAVLTPSELDAVKNEITTSMLPTLNTIIDEANKACAKLKQVSQGRRFAMVEGLKDKVGVAFGDRVGKRLKDVKVILQQFVAGRVDSNKTILAIDQLKAQGIELPAMIALRCLNGVALHHAKLSQHEVIRKYCDMDNETCLLRQSAKLMSPVVSKNLMEQVLLKLIPSKGCNSVDVSAVAALLHKFVGPLVKWNSVDAPEQTILVELSILVQPVSQVTSERQQKALEFFEAKDEEPNFWLKSVCTSPNFKDMLDLLKLSLAAFQSPSSGRQLGRLSKLIQKLVSLESSRNESYEHGKSMEVIEDIKGGMQRMIKPITEDAVDEDTASGYSSILDSVLDFQIKTIVQLDTGMSELVDGLADRNDKDIVKSNKAILDELKLRVNGMTPSLVEGQFKPKLETINKASGISVAMIPVYAVCADLALVSGGKSDAEFTHEEFALILRKAHLLMISRDRVNRKIREFNSSSGLPALKIPKSEVSFQELLGKYSGQERGAKMFADAFKDMSVVVYSRLTSDSADDKKKATAYM